MTTKTESCPQPRSANKVFSDFHECGSMLAIISKCFVIPFKELCLSLLFTPRCLNVLIDVLSLSDVTFSTLVNVCILPLSRIATAICQVMGFHGGTTHLMELIDNCKVRLKNWMNTNRTVDAVATKTNNKMIETIASGK